MCHGSADCAVAGICANVLAAAVAPAASDHQVQPISAVPRATDKPMRDPTPVVRPGDLQRRHEIAVRGKFVASGADQSHLSGVQTLEGQVRLGSSP